MEKITQKFYILTLGCQMNKNDSERVIGFLESLCFVQVDTAEEADLIILNTCSVRQSAEDRVFGFVQNWKKLKEKKPNLIIAVTGCMAGRDKDKKIRARLPDVDLFFGINDLPQLPRWLSELGLPVESAITDYLQIQPKRENSAQVFITIQTGCDNYCTYCVVPYARGREQNRSVAEILEEIKQAIANGAKEIMLLGQVVNNYKIKDQKSKSKNNPFFARDPLCVSPLKGGEYRFPSPYQGEGEGEVSSSDDFAALLWEIDQIPGEFRINFTAPDPQYFSDEQVEALKLSKQTNYLHLPVQAGSNEILKKMNRHYTREQYIELIKKIRQARPEIAIGTDIIVGFCGETEDQFEQTVDLYKQCDFDISYHAKYSERSGTVAAKNFKDDILLNEKKRRWGVLQNLMEEIVLRKNQKYLGQSVRVLVNKCENGICSGNSDEMKLVEFPGDASLIGQFVKIKINFAEKWVLRGNKI